MTRRLAAIVLALLTLAVLAPPALAQTVASVRSRRAASDQWPVSDQWRARDREAAAAWDRSRAAA